VGEGYEPGKAVIAAHRPAVMRGEGLVAAVCARGCATLHHLAGAFGKCVVFDVHRAQLSRHVRLGYRRARGRPRARPTRSAAQPGSFAFVSCPASASTKQWRPRAGDFAEAPRVARTEAALASSRRSRLFRNVMVMSAPSIRIATLNVWGRFCDWPARLHVLEREWSHVDADVLLLQEVCRDDAGNQGAEVAARLGCAFLESTDGHDYPGGSEGVAIASRVALERLRDEQLPPSTPPRRALMASVALGQRTLTLVCGHTVAVPENVRASQVTALLSRHERPLVIGGDLNVEPEDLEIALERVGLTDSLAADPTPTWPMCIARFGTAWSDRFGRTPHFPLHPKRVDYLLSRGLAVTRSHAFALGSDEQGFASDHAIVYADYVLDA